MGSLLSETEKAAESWERGAGSLEPGAAKQESVPGACEASSSLFLPPIDDDAMRTKQKAQPRRLSLFPFSTL